MVSKTNHVFKKTKKGFKKNSPVKNENQPLVESDKSALFSYKPLNYLLILYGMQKVTFTGRKVVPVGWFSKLFTTILALSVFFLNGWIKYDLIGKEGKHWPIIATVIDLLGSIVASIGATLSALLSVYLISPFIHRAFKGFISVDEKLGINKKAYYLHFKRRIILFEILYLLFAIMYLAYQYYVGIDLWWTGIQISLVSMIDNIMIIELIDFSVIVWFVVSRFNVYNKQMSDFISSFSQSEIKNISENQNKLSNTEKPMEIWSTFNISVIPTIKENQENDKNEILLKFMRIFDELADIVYIISSCFGVNVSMVL